MIFYLVLTQKILKKMKKIKNHTIVSIFFVDDKDVDFDVNTAKNAGDDDVAGNDFFFTIFIYFSMIMMSTNYFYLF